MDMKVVTKGIRDLLINASLAPNRSWPNVDTDPSVLPRFEVTFPVRDVIGGTLKGNEIRRVDGFCSIVICTAHGLGEDDGLDYFDALRAVFYEGRTVTITGGKVVFETPLTIRATPFPDDTSYRIPTGFDFTAYQDL